MTGRVGERQVMPFNISQEARATLAKQIVQTKASMQSKITMPELPGVAAAQLSRTGVAIWQRRQPIVTPLTSNWS